MRPLATYDARESTPTIVTAGTILTVDPDAPRAEAMLASVGMILAVGSRTAVEEQASAIGGSWARIGATMSGIALIAPGFLDTAEST